VTGVAFGASDTFTWDIAPGATAYNVYRGTIPTVGGMASRGLGPGAYDHACFEARDAQGNGPTLSEDTELPSAYGVRAFYYLVTSLAASGEGSLGQSSQDHDPPTTGDQLERPNGTPCPRGIRLRIGAGGTGNVAAMIVTVTHPTPQVALEANGVVPVGPLAPGSPGNPTTTSDAAVAGEVRVASFFTSFGATFAAPTPTHDLSFTYQGATPSLGDFAFSRCQLLDSSALPVPTATCELQSLTMAP
jgi:hypothetical protein